MDEFKESYSQLFQNLKQRGLETPSLVVSDTNKGLIAAIRESFPGASWQRCKVHFMRNILAHVPQKEKDSFAAQLKEIWLGPSAELASQRAKQLSERYEKRFPKAIEILEEGLEDSLAFYAFPELDAQNLFNQHAGAAEQRNPPQNERCWDFSQPGFLSPISDNLPHRVCRRLGCFQSIPESEIHSDPAVKRSLIHRPESPNCELPLTQP